MAVPASEVLVPLTVPEIVSAVAYLRQHAASLEGIGPTRMLRPVENPDIREARDLADKLKRHIPAA